MKWLLACLLLVPALAVGQPNYSDEWKEHYSKLLARKPTFDSGIPLEPNVVSTSPHEYATATLTRTDGVKVAPNKATAHIAITSKYFSPVYVEVRFFRTVTLSWVTDRIVVIDRDIGHRAGIDEVLDVVDRKWLSQEGIGYGPE